VQLNIIKYKLIYVVRPNLKSYRMWHNDFWAMLKKIFGGDGNDLFWAARPLWTTGIRRQPVNVD